MKPKELGEEIKEKLNEWNKELELTANFFGTIYISTKDKRTRINFDTGLGEEEDES